MRISVSMFLCLSLILSVGCGGGGGGGGAVPITDAFFGVYSLGHFGGDFGPPLTATATWGSLSADGMGTISDARTAQISNGVLSPEGVGTTQPYTLLPGNRMQWNMGPTVLAEGGLAADGSLAAMALVALNSEASLIYAVRRGAGFSVASLNGTYHYAQFAASPTGTGDVSVWGAVVFDGTGGCTFTLWSNTNGTVAGPGPAAGTYAVAASGELTLTAGATSYRGGITHGGNVGLFSGSTVAGGVASVGVFVKYSTGATAASFNGPYNLVAISADQALAPLSNWQALTGTLNASGAGTFMFTNMTQIDDHGVVTPGVGPYPPIAYTVAGNGGMTISLSTAGAISPDGRVVAFVGGTTPLSDMSLWLLVR